MHRAFFELTTARLNIRYRSLLRQVALPLAILSIVSTSGGDEPNRRVAVGDTESVIHTSGAATSAAVRLPDWYSAGRSEQLSTTPEDSSSVPGSAVPVVNGSEAAPAVTDELGALQRRLELLEAAEKDRTKRDSAKAAEAKKRAAERKAIHVDKWNVKLGGHVQLDYVNWARADESITGNPGPSDYFEFRRLRLVADGTGYENCDFRLQMTLEPETVGESGGAVTSPDVKDAYFSANEIPGLGRFRIGNFFVPFGLEQVTNDTNNIFMERSIPTQGVFTADREVGVALYNCSEDQSLGWSTGVFFDSINEALKERIDDNQGYRTSGRLTWTPFYDDSSSGRYLIHTGVGVLHTQDQDQRVRFRSRPQIHEGPRLIDSGVINANSYTTGNLEFAAVMGPVTLQSEAFLSTVNQLGGGAETLGGAYAHLSWFLTGENRVYDRFGQHGAQFARNVPKANLRLNNGVLSPGAWELKTRYSNLNLDNFNKGQYNDLTCGVNCYGSDRTRVMVDWIHPVTTSATTFGDTTSDILAMRFDFNW
ncbi:MAG: porin [Planctomycetia bacterium]